MTRFEFWQQIAISAVSNPRVRTGKQAAHLIEFMMKQYDKEAAAEDERRRAQWSHMIHLEPEGQK